MAGRIYELLSSSINAGDYTLSEMQKRVSVLYAAGFLSDDERSNLLEQAEVNLDPENERGDVQEQLEYLGDLITSLTERVVKLEAVTSQLSGDSVTVSIEDGWASWEQPIAGLTTNYQYGDIVYHNGKLWISTYAGQNVWEPGAVGTENLWVEYDAETEEEGE